MLSFYAEWIIVPLFIIMFVVTIWKLFSASLINPVVLLCFLSAVSIHQITFSLYAGFLLFLEFLTESAVLYSNFFMILINLNIFPNLFTHLVVLHANFVLLHIFGPAVNLFVGEILFLFRSSSLQQPSVPYFLIELLLLHLYANIFFLSLSILRLMLSFLMPRLNSSMFVCFHPISFN